VYAGGLPAFRLVDLKELRGLASQPA
jgi:hypothetical protein